MSIAGLSQGAKMSLGGRVVPQVPSTERRHPSEVLLGAQASEDLLPVCDHFSGVEARMRKSLALQLEMSEEFGTNVFDVTLDCEDGAPVGGEKDHATMIAELAKQARNSSRKLAPERTPRVAVRLHPVDHPAFEQEVDIVVGGAAKYICHLMIPKVETVAQIQRTVQLVDLLAAKSGRTSAMPLHVLIESPKAVHLAYEIAEHDRVQSLSFGLMDFVSAHGGAIPVSAMGLAFGDELDQFSHPLVVRAKLEIVSACHAHGKVPSHCIVVEIDDAARVLKAASRACRAFGYTRMWSIHPGQIKPILEAFAPSEHEIDQAVEVMLAAEQANWAPISLGGKLNDRASYRYFWQVLERAQRTGRQMPVEARRFFQ